MTSPSDGGTLLSGGYPRFARHGILPRMKRAMGIFGQGYKVLRSVVGLDAVDVVDNLIRFEWSTVGLLPNKALFLNIAVDSSQAVAGQIDRDVAIMNPPLQLGSWLSRCAGPMAYRNVEESAVAIARTMGGDCGMNPLAAAASTWRALIRYANETLAPALALRGSPFLGVALTKAKIRTVFMPRFRLDWKAAATGAIHAISVAQ